MKNLAQNNTTNNRNGTKTRLADSTELPYHGTVPYAFRANNDEAQSDRPTVTCDQPQATIHEQNSALNMLYEATEPAGLPYYRSVPHAYRGNQPNQWRPINKRPPYIPDPPNNTTDLQYIGTTPYALREDQQNNNIRMPVLRPAPINPDRLELGNNFKYDPPVVRVRYNINEPAPAGLQYPGSVPYAFRLPTNASQLIRVDSSKTSHALRSNQTKQSRNKPRQYTSDPSNNITDLQYAGTTPYTFRENQRNNNNNIPKPVLRPAPINPVHLGPANNFKYDPPVVRVRYSVNEPAPVGLQYPGSVPYAYRLSTDVPQLIRVDSSSMRRRNKPSSSQQIPAFNKPQAPESPILQYPGTTPYSYRVDVEQTHPAQSQLKQVRLNQHSSSREGNGRYNVTIGGIKNNNGKKNNSSSKGINHSNNNIPTASVEIGVWHTIDPVQGKLSNWSQQKSSISMPGYKAFNKISS